jgi:hypothetical protein
VSEFGAELLALLVLSGAAADRCCQRLLRIARTHDDP